MPPITNPSTLARSTAQKNLHARRANPSSLGTFGPDFFKDLPDADLARDFRLEKERGRQFKIRQQQRDATPWSREAAIAKVRERAATIPQSLVDHRLKIEQGQVEFRRTMDYTEPGVGGALRTLIRQGSGAHMLDYRGSDLTEQQVRETIAQEQLSDELGTRGLGPLVPGESLRRGGLDPSALAMTAFRLQKRPDKLVPLAHYVTDYADTKRQSDARHRIAKGKGTPKDFKLVQKAEDLARSNQGRYGDLSYAGQVLHDVGKVAESMVPFALEFYMLAPAAALGRAGVMGGVAKGGLGGLGRGVVGGGVRGLTGGVVKKAVPLAAQGITRRAIRRGAGLMAAAAVQATVAAPLRIPTIAMQRQMPRFIRGENGQLTVDPNWEPEGWTKATFAAATDHYIEYLSEHMGGGLMKLLGGKYLAKIAGQTMGRMGMKHAMRLPDSVGKFLRRSAWHGVAGETLEELAGEVMRAGAGIKEFELPSPKDFLSQTIAFSLVPGTKATIEGIETILTNRSIPAELRDQLVEANAAGLMASGIAEPTARARAKKFVQMVVRAERGAFAKLTPEQKQARMDDWVDIAQIPPEQTPASFDQLSEDLPAEGDDQEEQTDAPQVLEAPKQTTATGEDAGAGEAVGGEDLQRTEDAGPDGDGPVESPAPVAGGEQGPTPVAKPPTDLERQAPPTKRQKRQLNKFGRKFGLTVEHHDTHSTLTTPSGKVVPVVFASTIDQLSLPGGYAAVARDLNVPGWEDMDDAAAKGPVDTMLKAQMLGIEGWQDKPLDQLQAEVAEHPNLENLPPVTRMTRGLRVRNISLRLSNGETLTAADAILMSTIQGRATTLPHEAVHAFVQDFLKPQEVSDLLDRYKKMLGPNFGSDTEYLAEGIARDIAAGEQHPIIQKILELLQEIIDLATAGTKAQNFTAQDLLKQMKSGEFYKRTENFGRSPGAKPAGEQGLFGQEVEGQPANSYVFATEDIWGDRKFAESKGETMQAAHDALMDEGVEGKELARAQFKRQGTGVAVDPDTGEATVEAQLVPDRVVTNTKVGIYTDPSKQDTLRLLMQRSRGLEDRPRALRALHVPSTGETHVWSAYEREHSEVAKALGLSNRESIGFVVSENHRIFGVGSSSQVVGSEKNSAELVAKSRFAKSLIGAGAVTVKDLQQGGYYVVAANDQDLPYRRSGGPTGPSIEAQLVPDRTIGRAEVYTNPTGRETRQLISESEMGQLRGVYDPGTNEAHLWDAATQVHRQTTDGLDLSDEGPIGFTLDRNDEIHLGSMIGPVTTMKKRMVQATAIKNSTWGKEFYGKNVERKTFPGGFVYLRPKEALAEAAVEAQAVKHRRIERLEPTAAANLRAQFEASSPLIGPQESAALVALVEAVASYKNVPVDKFVEQAFDGVVKGGQPAPGALHAFRENDFRAAEKAGVLSEKSVALLELMEDAGAIHDEVNTALRQNPQGYKNPNATNINNLLRRRPELRERIKQFEARAAKAGIGGKMLREGSDREIAPYELEDQLKEYDPKKIDVARLDKMGNATTTGGSWFLVGAYQFRTEKRKFATQRVRGPFQSKAGATKALARLRKAGKPVPTNIPVHGALGRSLSQTWFESMLPSVRDTFRTEMVGFVESAYKAGTLKKARFGMSLAVGTLGEGFGGINNRVLKKAEKTRFAINLNTMCPMLSIGPHGCYSGCYMVQGWRAANSQTVYRSGVYTGEILQWSQDEIDVANSAGGLRVNGAGDWSPEFEPQIRDVVRHAKMRGLNLKVISKQKSSWAMIDKMYADGLIDAKNPHLQLQPTLDPYWVDADRDAKDVSMGFNTIAEQTNDPAVLDMARDYYSLADRDTKEIDGRLWRKYGLSEKQYAAWRKQYRNIPEGGINKRYVVGSPKDIFTILRRNKGKPVILTWMHASISGGLYNDIDRRVLTGGDISNFDSQMVVKKNSKTGKWEVLAAPNKRALTGTTLKVAQVTVKGEGLKGEAARDRVTGLVGGHVPRYDAIADYIYEHAKDRKEANGLFQQLKDSSCCQANEFADACLGCNTVACGQRKLLGDDHYNKLDVNGVSKASVEFGSDGKALIRALTAANVVDMAHELGHVFRRALNREDLSIVETWAGVEDGNWTRPAEELWANTFERYLAEGRAPTPALARVFAQFKEWLANIFRGIKGTEVESRLTPEIKGVMDRMLGATQAQVRPISFDRQIGDVGILENASRAKVQQLLDRSENKFLRGIYDPSDKSMHWWDGSAAEHAETNRRLGTGDRAFSVQMDASGGVWVTGWTEGYGRAKDAVILRRSDFIRKWFGGKDTVVEKDTDWGGAVRIVSEDMQKFDDAAQLERHVYTGEKPPAEPSVDRVVNDAPVYRSPKGADLKRLMSQSRNQQMGGIWSEPDKSVWLWDNAEASHEEVMADLKADDEVSVYGSSFIVHPHHVESKSVRARDAKLLRRHPSIKGLFGGLARVEYPGADGPQHVEASGGAQPVVEAQPVHPQTLTPQFKRWFGKSKVVDDDGKPMVVYHGTGRSFTVFDSEFESDEYLSPHKEHFFTSSSEEAGKYAADRGQDWWVVYELSREGDDGAGDAYEYFTLEQDAKDFVQHETVGGFKVKRVRRAAAVMPVYLSLQNPLVVDGRGQTWSSIPLPPELLKRVEELAATKAAAATVRLDWLAVKARQLGHDGLIVRNVVDSTEGTHLDSGIKPQTTYVAFKPTQIKSATGNVGAFDPTKASIEAQPVRQPGQTKPAKKPTPALSMTIDPETGLSDAAVAEVAEGLNKVSDLGGLEKKIDALIIKSAKHTSLNRKVYNPERLITLFEDEVLKAATAGYHKGFVYGRDTQSTTTRELAEWALTHLPATAANKVMPAIAAARTPAQIKDILDRMNRMVADVYRRQLIADFKGAAKKAKAVLKHDEYEKRFGELIDSIALTKPRETTINKMMSLLKAVDRNQIEGEASAQVGGGQDWSGIPQRLIERAREVMHDVRLVGTGQYIGDMEPEAIEALIDIVSQLVSMQVLRNRTVAKKGGRDATKINDEAVDELRKANPNIRPEALRTDEPAEIGTTFGKAIKWGLMNMHRKVQWIAGKAGTTYKVLVKDLSRAAEDFIGMQQKYRDAPLEQMRAIGLTPETLDKWSLPLFMSGYEKIADFEARRRKVERKFIAENAQDIEFGEQDPQNPDIVDADGKVVKSLRLTPMERIELILHYWDQRTRGELLRRTGDPKVGGITLQERFNRPRYKMTYRAFDKIFAFSKDHDKREIQFANILFDLVNGELKDELNGVWQMMYGTKIAKGTNYWPSRRDSKHRPRNIDEEETMQAWVDRQLDQQAPFKARTGGTAPFVIADALQSYFTYVNRVSAMVAKAPAARNARILLESKLGEQWREEVIKRMPRGGELLRDLRETVGDWRGLDFEQNSNFWMRLVQTLIKRAHVGVLAFKPSVMAFQIPSLLSATNAIDAKYMLSGKNFNKVRVGFKDRNAEMMRESPLYWSRWTGVGHQILTPSVRGMSLRHFWDSKTGAIEKYGLGGIKSMDALVMHSIWEAVKEEGRDKHKLKGEALMAHARDRFREVVEDTQPTWDALSVAGLVRQFRKNPVAYLSVMYMSQRSKNVNMMVDAFLEFSQSDKTAADFGRFARKASVPMLITTALIAGTREGYNALVGLLVGDDGDEEKMWQDYTGEYFDTVFGNFAIIGDVVGAGIDSVLQVSKGEAGKPDQSFWKLESGSILRKATVDVANAFTSAASGIGNAISGAEYKGGDNKGKKKWWYDFNRSFESALKGGGILAGVPTSVAVPFIKPALAHRKKGKSYYYADLSDGLKSRDSKKAYAAAKRLRGFGVTRSQVKASMKSRGVYDKPLAERIEMMFPEGEKKTTAKATTAKPVDFLSDLRARRKAREKRMQSLLAR